MEFFIMIGVFVTIMTLISSITEYNKAKLKASSTEQLDGQLGEIRRELADVKEMVADVLLELDRQRSLPPGSNNRSLPLE